MTETQANVFAQRPEQSLPDLGFHFKKSFSSILF